MAQRKIFTPKGRLNRIHYLLYSCVTNLFAYGLIAIVIFISGLIIGSSPEHYGKTFAVLGTTWIILILTIIAAAWLLNAILQFFYASRRFHDMDAPGLLCFLFFIPLISIIMWFVLVFKAGVVQANQYGDIPAENTGAAKVGSIITLVLNVLFMAAISLFIAILTTLTATPAAH